jgi:ATP-binding cassette, subfamily B, bacterial
MEFRYKSVFRHYWKFVRNYIPSQLILFSSYGVGQVLDIAVVPLLYKAIIDTVSSPPSDPSAVLFGIFWILVATYIIMNIVYRIGDYFIISSQSKILEDLSNYSLKELQKHSYTFFTNTFGGSLVAKSKRFVSAFETLHDQLIFSIWFGGISLISSVVVLSYFSWLLGLAFLAWIIVYVIMIRYLIRFQIPKSLENAEADTKVTAHFSDIIANFFTVKMFGAEKREEDSFAMTTKFQEAKRRRAWLQQGFWNSLYQSLNIGFFELLFIGFAIWLWLQGSITAGTIVLVQVYTITSFHVVWQISKNFIRITTALTDANEMVEIFDRDVDVVDGKQLETVKMSQGDILFDDVTFSYEGHTKVFTNFNLHIKSNEKIALVGASGAGKTTITKILLRFVDVDKGGVFIDGQGITAVSQQKLRQKISYVPQEPSLFHRTIRENIQYGNPSATQEEVVGAAKKAQAHDFIVELPNGYETLVGERGVKLSGGQKQRVAIARAILKDAPILVLDEATSALDSESEVAIQKALQELMVNRTVIAVAHRLSTLRKMDRIIVLENGKVIEDGTHEELSKAGNVYQRLWEHQAGGFLQDDE